MISVEKYTDKSFVVFGGNTKLIKDQLTSNGGKWNPNLTKHPGKGWIFSNSKFDILNSFIQEYNSTLEKNYDSDDSQKEKLKPVKQKIEKTIVSNKWIDPTTVHTDYEMCENGFKFGGYTFSYYYGSSYNIRIEDDEHRFSTSEFCIRSEELDIYFLYSDCVKDMDTDEDDMYKYIRRWGKDLPNFAIKLLKKARVAPYEEWKDLIIQLVILFIMQGPQMIAKKNLYRSDLERCTCFLFYSRLSRNDLPEKLK